MLRTALSNESGATSIEYALIAVFISIVIISGAQSVGLELIATFNVVAAGLR